MKGSNLEPTTIWLYIILPFCLYCIRRSYSVLIIKRSPFNNNGCKEGPISTLQKRIEAVGKRRWPNLPQQLLNLLARKPNLLQQLSYPAGTTKSRTTTTRRCSSGRHPQWPQLHDLEVSKWCSLSKIPPQFINIYFRTEVYHSWYYFSRVSPPQFWMEPTPHFVGYSQGSLVIRGPNPSDFYIYEVSTRRYGKLPPWDVRIPFKFSAQTSSTTGFSSMVVVTGISSPALVSLAGDAWIRQECNTIDPYDAKKQSMQFTNIIGLEGKFYALSLQGTLAVMEKINSRVVITAIGRGRAVPSVTARYFKEHLLESKGEILLVFLIYRKTLGVVDQVEVFRLHIPKLSWIKLECLQERALFLENECCIWVDSSQIGCRGNCVYFSQSAGDDWYTYDMETGRISPGMNISNDDR